MSDKYDNKGGQPPSYPQPVHQDAGPYGPVSPQPPQSYGVQSMYGQPQPYQYGQPQPNQYSPMQPNQYGHPQPNQPGASPGLQQGYYGSSPHPQDGYGSGTPGKPQEMNYGPPIQGQQGSPQYINHPNGGKPGGMGKGGCLAAFCSAVACCCCLDILI